MPKVEPACIICPLPQSCGFPLPQGGVAEAKSPSLSGNTGQYTEKLKSFVCQRCSIHVIGMRQLLKVVDSEELRQWSTPLHLCSFCAQWTWKVRTEAEKRSFKQSINFSSLLLSLLFQPPLALQTQYAESRAAFHRLPASKEVATRELDGRW